MLRIALTGGIASGKSTVAERFRELGVPVIDTDRLARDAVEPGSPALDRLVSRCGSGILHDDGSLNRGALRKRIFRDKKLRREVEAMLHPEIFRRLDAEISSTTGPYVVIEIPLLAETGSAEKFDRVLVVDCPESVQIARLMERDGMGNAAAKRILSAQAPREQRLSLADDIIENTGSKQNLITSVDSLHEKYLEFASQREKPAQ